MNIGTKQYHNRIDRIHVRRGILGCGEGFTVALDDKGCVRYTGENRWGQAAVTGWQGVLAVFCGPDYVLGLCKDGTVLREGRNHFPRMDMESWACVSMLACGHEHAAALIGNGRVLCAGDDSFGQCDTTLWRDMVDVCCGRHFTAGLHMGGQVLMAGADKNMAHMLESWQDVAGIFSDYEGKAVYGITRTEGKLLSTAHLPLSARKWRHLVYVAVSARGIVGVTSHGRILCTNQTDAKVFHRQVGEFVACGAGHGHVAVLCKSGEILATGRNEFGQAATTRWGCLYTGFEAFSTTRREVFAKKELTERNYQKAMSAAQRHGRRLSCGERLTACIQADGHVSATAGLRQAKTWRGVCALSCGSAHMVVLHKDGRVSADGNNVGGCCRVDSWRGGKAVLAGKYHSLCLREDGKVLFTGWNLHEQGNVEDWEHIRLLRGTDTYTVGLDTHGKIHISGKKLPFDPQDLDSEAWQNLVDIAVSDHHIVGLRADGRVVALGDDTCRISARKNATDVSVGVATDVTAWRGVRAIAVGDGFTVGLCYGGRVVAAGRNDLGQCNTQTWQHAVYVGCGRTYTAALLADGRVVTAGQHKSGAETKDTPGFSGGAVMSWEKAETTGFEPFRTDYMTDILALRTGPEHLVAVDIHGQVMAEGLDLDGQCTSASNFLLFRDVRQLDGFGIFGASGDLPTPTPPTSPPQDDTPQPKKSHQRGKNTRTSTQPHEGSQVWPRAMQRVTPIKLLSLAGQGLAHTACLCEDAHVTAWGYQTNAYSDVRSWGEARMVACGTHHTVAVLADGQVVATGRNAQGQCKVEAWHATDLTQIACCYHTTAALQKSGEVLMCGQGYGFDPTQLTNVGMLALGMTHMLAMTKDGHVIAKGDNTYGQCDTTTWENLTMVAAGERHSVGLTTDGHVIAVGDDTMGQCRVSDLSQVTYIACLPEATLCVLTDGHVVVRGGGGMYDDTVRPLQNVVAVYGCEYRISALMSDGSLVEVV